MKRLVFCAMLLTGCSASEELEVVGPPRWMECTDFRDGEKFLFHTNSLKLSPGATQSHYQIEITDAQGRRRYLTEVDDANMKCVERILA